MKMMTNIRRNAVAVASVFALATAPFVPATGQSFQIQETISPAGHDIWLVEERSNPIVTLEITFQNGSYADPVGKDGVTQMLGWLFNEGAGDLTAAEFQGVMQEQSFSIAADAGFDRTTIEVQYLTENQELVFEMLELALEQPRFDADAIDRARDYFANQVIRRMNGPSDDFFEVFGPLQYGEGHPFLRYSNGSIETLESITRDDLMAAHARVYATAGVEVNAVGDIDLDRLSAEIDALLADLPVGREIAKRPAPSPVAQNLEVVTPFAQPVTVVVATATADITNKSPDRNALRIADQILGGEGLGSRLFASVRDEAGLVYSISSSTTAGDDFGRIGFSFQTANESVDDALALALDVIADFAQNGPTQAEVDKAIALITGGYPLRFQTSRDVAGYMNTMRNLELPVDFPSYRNAEIEAVSLEDVKRVARQYYSDPKFLIGMIGQPENRVPGVHRVQDVDQ